MSTNVFSGARAIFKINSNTVAFASGCDGSEEVSYEAVDVLDSVEVSEYVPTGYRVSFNCNIFRTVGPGSRITGTGKGSPAPSAGQIGSLKKDSIGIFPRSTGTPSRILTDGSMDATVTDRLTNTAVAILDQVKAQSMNFSITARGIVGQNVSFNAIRMRDESDVA